MHRSLRLPIAFLGFVVALAILVSGSFLLNKWLPQPDDVVILDYGYPSKNPYGTD
jgi:hypothetical protein